MKIFRVLRNAFLIFIIFIVSSFLILDSDLVEKHRLKDQIQKNLEIELTEAPRIIDRESYGFIEEGGDIALLLLNVVDCISLHNVMEKTEKCFGSEEYYEMFEANGLKPKIVKTWYRSNEHGDFTQYVFWEPKCYLYRHYFSE